MTLLITFILIIIFYCADLKEEDSIDRVRNYGFGLLMVGLSLWVCHSIFGGALAIPRGLEVRYVPEDDAKILVKIMTGWGVVQSIVGVALRWRWPRKN